ncbi:Rne/Rng family ribonuclease [Paenibacillus xylaniclasticus]|uniref:Rne/Rng family ribonuclease n=1 Tax=Paenibacillus xylaniclasticus TaxID=588083 RepID=UPI000FD8F880|nr:MULTISPECIES: Rne/Rng family ribonuclease [Paenibacillus]GFN33620.1 ribonuclease [Paenibacillus curdlanolyticus]
MRQLLIQNQDDGIHAAVLEDGVLIDYASELREEDRPGGGSSSLLGNVYKGKVMNVLPGMQAAFVDIGLSKNAFLYIDDVLHPNLEKRERAVGKQKPLIQNVVRVGQELIVQVMREPGGGKGARITTHISLPGRWLVYMPEAAYVGVSRKIGDEAERERLRVLGERLRTEEEGLIIRTAASGVPDSALAEEVASLREVWQETARQSQQVKAPAVLHRESGLVRRVIRDMLTTDTDEIWVENDDILVEMKELMKQSPMSGFAGIVRRSEQAAGLFVQFGVDVQLEKAFARMIQLASGGYIVWEETEALTVIDVNTGKFTGGGSLEETMYRTNEEAAELIARLLRIRDTGGIVIVDFIDMEEEANRQRISQRIETLTRGDRSRCTVVGWTRLGLLEITRKKARFTKRTARGEASESSCKQRETQ